MEYHGLSCNIMHYRKIISWNINGSNKLSANLLLRALNPHVMILIEPRKNININNYNTLSSNPTSDKINVNIIFKDGLSIQRISNPNYSDYISANIKLSNKTIHIIAVY